MVELESLIDKIYEAAFFPEEWPGVLEALGHMSGSAGGALLTTGSRHPPRWAATANVAPALQAFAAGDAWKDNKRPARWMSAGHPGFLRDVDLFTAEELQANRTAGDLKTHGLGWQLGTVVPMSSGEVVVFSLERAFDKGPHEARMRDIVDPLRPHLARAGLLAARLGLERAQTAVTTLEAIGLPAAVTNESGRVLVANGLIDKLQVLLPAAYGAVALENPLANELLQASIAGAASGSDESRSIPIPGTETTAAVVVHVMPLPGAAYDIFSGAAVLIMATTIVPNEHRVDLTVLSGLFDLTPSEAKLAAPLSAGATLAVAAESQNIRMSTARSYLESVFRKTGVGQQSQLVALLKSAQPFKRP